MAVPRKPNGSPKAGDEAWLEEAWARDLASRPGEIPYFTKEAIREDIRLRHYYTGKYVAYIDRWRGRTGHRRLIREVIAVADTPWDLSKLLADVPKSKLKRIMAYRIDSPEDGIFQ